MKKHCQLGNHNVEELWRARGKDKESGCKECVMKEKSLTSSVIKPKKPINKVSGKQAKINAAYSVLRKQFLKDHESCEAQLEGCTYQATQCHHAKGRLGGNMLNDKTFVALCDSCHRYIETHPNEAKELGYSHNRLDKL